MLRLTCVIAIIAATGCTLDFGGDDGGDDCRYEGAYEPAPAPLLLNPETLQCETFSYPCDPYCGPCAGGSAVALPSWAYCGEGCEALDELTCLATTACRAAYDYSCYTGDGPCSALDPFIGCYGVDQTGPVAGPCDGLLAQECSAHDDCIALHTPQCSGDPSGCWQQFVECRDEATCYGVVLCDGAPPNCPPGSVPAIKNGCYTGDCILVGNCEPCTEPCE